MRFMLTKAAKDRVEQQFSFYVGMSKLFGRKLEPSCIPPVVSCVYAFEMSDGTVKIGVTKNLEQRIKDVASNFYLDVLRVYHTDYAPRMFMYTIENRCHGRFSDFRVRGEFFAIPFEDACAELDRHAKDIATALKIADENFIDEVKYFEELREKFFATPLVPIHHVPETKPVVTKKTAEEPEELFRVCALLLSDKNVAIGCTKNLIASADKIKRETGLTVVDIYFTPEMPRKYARLVEWASQEKFSPQRIRGEYFAAKFSKVCATVKYYVELISVAPIDYDNIIADKNLN